MKEIKDMSDEELVKELEGIEDHIDNYSYGRYELSYREQLYQEIEKRGIEVQESTRLKIIENAD